MKFKHSTLSLVAGVIWLLVGVFLMNKGLKLVSLVALPPFFREPMLSDLLAPYVGGAEKASVIAIVSAMFIGYFKGRFVLAKTVKRMIARLQRFESPVPIYKIYAWYFYLIVAAMIGLGVFLKAVSVFPDLIGMIDLAIGCALVNGAVFYFKAASDMRRDAKYYHS